MDLVAVRKDGEWVPISKRGKLPGRKKVYRCASCDVDVVALEGEHPKCPKCGSPMSLLTRCFMREGRILEELPPPSRVREKVLGSLPRLEL
jgi:Nicotinic acid phosphoribosyltransferase